MHYKSVVVVLSSVLGVGVHSLYDGAPFVPSVRLSSYASSAAYTFDINKDTFRVIDTLGFHANVTCGQQANAIFDGSVRRYDATGESLLVRSAVSIQGRPQQHKGGFDPRVPFITKLAVTSLSVNTPGEERKTEGFQGHTNFHFGSTRNSGAKWEWEWRDSVVAPGSEKSLTIAVHVVDPALALASNVSSDLQFIPQAANNPANNVVFELAESDASIKSWESPNQKLYANKDLLAAKSKYCHVFFTRFTPLTQDGKTLIECPFPRDVMFHLLSFLYQGAIPFAVSDPMFARVHQAASYYAIDSFDVYAVLEVIKSHIARNNFDLARTLLQRYW
jgi:hypothetical protein